ncbi:GTP cyclohydrolase FolE2 [Kangiella geojedonensis]|uniref:GTP cyclohydrolase FolE2 n=2 Tax=Kangiella geojedonensis TaxID=914150 RepID=A0A0F6RC20_9GAMM|nr:GTP cyclohydrolase FolE2 [Kangiella geojedonensis]
MIKEQLPDITSDTSSQKSYSLRWVGMEGIAVPLHLSDKDAVGQVINSSTSIYVSLDSVESKGIHMSRLHKNINQLSTLKLAKQSLDKLLRSAIKSQEGISCNAKVRLEFDVTFEKSSLLSKNSGYQSYPVAINGEASLDNTDYEYELTIPYSSTCPCSAALARQLYSQQIDQRFEGESISKQELLNWVQSAQNSFATPHSQRSYAYLKLKLKQGELLSLKSLITVLEDVIGTPVQTVVKRVDEQEFARLNGQNLMFCEDAARKLKQYLEQNDSIVDYWIKVEHQESLHAHNAVVMDQKQQVLDTKL